MSLNLFIRIAALLGAMLILAAALSSALNVQLARRFRRPFTDVHHPLAITGAVLIVIHPLLVAIQLKSARILIPNFESFRSFWTMAGCPALILIALAIFSALLMRRIRRFWRWGHWLIYPALLMAGIHGLRMGQDLKNPFLAACLGILLALALAVFLFKRLKSRTASKAIKQN